MMKNIYDNEKFFEQYSQMSRSKNGLSFAGEWHQLKPLFPTLEGKSVLDLGCGYGWHCKYSEENGAKTILGIDLSEKMILEAQKRNSGKNITYHVLGINEYDYPNDTWDIVISNLVLHYVEDLNYIFRQIYKTLKNDGVFLFNIEHPIFTSGIKQDWIYDSDNSPIYWPVDNYFTAGMRQTQFLGCDVNKYHHTLTEILMGLIESGFTIEVVEEAKPTEEMLKIPEMMNELRRPMMLLVRARANKYTKMPSEHRRNVSDIQKG